MRAIWPGELIVLVGPSRVGKSRCISDALSVPFVNVPDTEGTMRVVMVEAENSSKGGEFSTKAFMVACLKAIRHPIYGGPANDDLWGSKFDQLLHKTSEATLRDAFERALKLRQVEYLVIDEAHHVQYVAGGDNAATRVLDSWKCLASKAKVKLVLSGSYKLLSLLGLAPHLIGRQQPLNFGRYKATSRTEVENWEQVLREFNELLQLKDGESLSTWNRTLFDGSLGCVGLLSQWIRACLASMLADEADTVTLERLQSTRLPSLQERDLLAEILIGEEDLKRAHEQISPPVQSSAPKPASEKKTSTRKPFQRKSRRSAAGGRA
ncbi:AAA family ATPase [Rhodanobacter sp. OR87]|uniref:AAA family ATPase n=1 Tax=Rhodanobacter sp. OR87 TaxID=1076523 RepID=UPI0018CA8CB0|nr:AAA family ATPase [Rhodanobacter sp. OR87]